MHSEVRNSDFCCLNVWFEMKEKQSELTIDRHADWKHAHLMATRAVNNARCLKERHNVRAICCNHIVFPNVVQRKRLTYHFLTTLNITYPNLSNNT